MTPGDVSMLLNETNGLRVQTTSPSLGGANVRIQGLRGRYTQILADGLPLYGGQTGSSGCCRFHRWTSAGGGDQGRGIRALRHVGHRRRGQPRVVAAAHRGSRGGSAVEPDEPAGNRCRQLAGRAARRTLGLYLRRRRPFRRTDTTWTATDGPICRCTAARSPGRGSSGRTAGASRSCWPSAAWPRNARAARCPAPRCPTVCRSRKSLETTRLDGGAVLRIATSKGVVFSARGSGTRQAHTHTFGSVIERDTHQTVFGEIRRHRHRRTSHVGGRRSAATTTATTLPTCPGSTTATPCPVCSCRTTSRRRTG